MKNIFKLGIFCSAFLTLILALACSSTARPERLTRLAVTGNADTQTPPDTAVLTISVLTTNQRAVEAQQQNARKSDAVRGAVIEVAGANPEIRTSDYNLQPQYDYRNRLPTIIGYEARNTVIVMMSDLNNVGAVIDAASRAGANSIERVSFVLRGDNPARGRALSEATRQAMGKAEAIAEALGGRIVRVVEEREAGANMPPIGDETEMREVQRQAGTMNSNMSMRNAPPITPVEAGSLNVRSQVQLIVEIEGRS